MAQQQRLEGHGQEPSQEELDKLAWPHSEWWQDRDRIVLLYEYLLCLPPDGSYNWESGVTSRAVRLWSDGREGGCDIGGGYYRMAWQDFVDDEAPGWRMLSSLPSCPNHHMRFPMSRALLDRVREHARDSSHYYSTSAE